MSAPTSDSAPPVAANPLKRAIAWLETNPWGESLYLFLLVWCIYALSGCLKPTHYLAHVYLADHFLHGRFDMDGIPAFMEQTRYNGHTYVAYGIAPSLLMMPFLAMLGGLFSQTLFSAALAALAVTLWWNILGKMQFEAWWRTWLTACFGFGSLFWFYGGQNGNTWSIMHVVVCLGLMLAIHDCVGKQRAWVAGLGLGLAVLSRQSVFLALPFFVAMLWRDDRQNGGNGVPMKALLFAIGLGLPMAFNAYYNFARFGDPMDNGYAKVIKEYQNLPSGFFSLDYLKTNLNVYFLGVPERIHHFPWFNPTMGGLSMFLTTPALFFAFFANWRERINVMAAIAIAPILAFYMVYHWTGFAQFGCRYSIDFLPFAMLLIASGVRGRWQRGLTTAVLAGVVVEIWGLFWFGIKEW